MRGRGREGGREDLKWYYGEMGKIDERDRGRRGREKATCTYVRK